MPYKSKAQRGYFHAMEEKGKFSHDMVHHWDQASKGKKLPEHAKKHHEGSTHAGETKKRHGKK